MRKAIIIYSGGLDSTTLLYKIKAEGYDISALSFDYNQKHKKELLCAKRICKKLRLSHKIVNLKNINSLIQGSSLTSDIAVPEGHYSQENMKQTVVPNRNMILLSLATGYAVSIGANDVFIGVHSGDHFIYKDCRQEFIEKLSSATLIANDVPVTIHAPFIKLNKGDIAKLGYELNVPYQTTWTCYRGEQRPCLKCGSCVERCEAFKQAGFDDPLLTQDEWYKAVENLEKFKKEYEKQKERVN